MSVEAERRPRWERQTLGWKNLALCLGLPALLWVVYLYVAGLDAAKDLGTIMVLMFAAVVPLRLMNRIRMTRRERWWAMIVSFALVTFLAASAVRGPAEAIPIALCAVFPILWIHLFNSEDS